MRTSLNIQNHQVFLKGDTEIHETLTQSIDALSQGAQKIGKLFQKKGAFKFIHQDQQGATAFSVDEQQSGKGTRIDNAAVCHFNLLKTL